MLGDLEHSPELVREVGYIDMLYTRDFEENKEVFAAKGKVVIYINYFDYADMDVLLKNVNEKIGMISE